MPSGPPNLIALDHDEFHAKWVGRLADGRQFFGSFPFVPGGPSFVALYLFDARGRFIEAKVEKTHQGDEDGQGLLDRWVAELGPVTFGRIQMAPFQCERFGITFGLVPRAGDGKNDAWWAEFHPGNYMAFSEPWDGGEYST